ncbi:hypothetical protein J3458_004526 [Metarhizium acridum]|uniref:uncharacterized protein n=1 Tax=Metarhizium acridum TaxID=92637 RepID=UPI001C6CFBF8|nr:hypothetical protein J3458_004526 [Metarhizium acridum]
MSPSGAGMRQVRRIQPSSELISLPMCVRRRNTSSIFRLACRHTPVSLGRILSLGAHATQRSKDHVVTPAFVYGHQLIVYENAAYCVDSLLQINSLQCARARSCFGMSITRPTRYLAKEVTCLTVQALSRTSATPCRSKSNEDHDSENIQ